MKHNTIYRLISVRVRVYIDYSVAGIIEVLTTVILVACLTKKSIKKTKKNKNITRLERETKDSSVKLGISFFIY